MSDDEGFDEEQGTCAATVGCHRNPAPGLLVCRGHFQRLSDILREIEDEAAQLSAVPSMQVRSGRGGSLASQRAPARLDVLVHNDPRHGTGMSEDDDDELAAGKTMSILATLHSWARVIREERDLTSSERATVASERAVLSRHLEWVAVQAWVDELYGDVSTLLGQLRSANHHRPDRPIARCVLSAIDGLCGGNIWEQERAEVVTYADGSQYVVSTPDGPAMCDHCGATWVTPEDKARLKLMIEQEHDERTRPRTEDGRKMLTAQELVDAGKVTTVGNVRVQAHRRGMAAVNGHYDPEWFGSGARDIA